jgi:hypothetical protein
MKLHSIIQISNNIKSSRKVSRDARTIRYLIAGNTFPNAWEEPGIIISRSKAWAEYVAHGGDRKCVQNFGYMHRLEDIITIDLKEIG